MIRNIILTSTHGPSKKVQKPITTSKSSPTLKKFLNAGKTKTPVITAVDRHLLTRPRDTSRRTDVLHPSEIVSKDWCHRASYFLLRGEQPAAEPSGKQGLKRSLVFAEGHRIHDKWQSLFRDMGTLYGTWRCVMCSHLWWDTSPNTCPKCSKQLINYAEVPVEHKDFHIQGRADGWLTKITPEPLLLEIKSMGPGTFIFEDLTAWEAANKDYETAWKALSQPFFKHNMQAQIYMHLLQDLPDAPQTAVFIYESKPNQMVKEFHVPRDASLVEPIMDSAKFIADSLTTQTPPECNIRGMWKCWRCEDYE